LISSAWLCACGVQGPPRPPRVEQPQSVRDLAVAQSSRTLTFTFTVPQLATDGQRLTKPLEMQLLRAISPAGQAAPPTREALQPWLAASAEEFAKLAKNDKVADLITLSETEFREQCGKTILFALRTLTRGFRHRPIESQLSNLVSITLLDVPLAVLDLRVTTTEHALKLSWNPPERALSGEPASSVSAYRIYRRSGEQASFAKIGETTDTVFRDPDFAFGRTYAYKVTALMKVGREIAEGEESPVAEVTPRDTFPPAAPTGLTAVYTTKAVELVWTANSEPDLAGYNVYRREGSATVEKLNADLLRTPIFRDTAAAAGHTYSYRVTALDFSNNESPPSEEVSVETR
jgi:hypothetical protein